MKKIFLICFAVAVLCVSCNTSQYKEMQVLLPDLTDKADGTYRGEVDFTGTPIKVVLDVTLLDQVITSVNIIKHISSPIGKKAERIIDEIIEQQSLDIDVVSGATVSGKAILKAVEKALE